MALSGNYITAKEASIFYKCRVDYARKKMKVLAAFNQKFRYHNGKHIPDIKNISYKEFAEAHGVTMSELEIILK